MTISLNASVRTCKIDTGYANKLESNRFLNPNLMVCPIWNGMDTTNRMVSPDTFYTKNAGCNSAEDRVVVENSLRPQYSSYINLSADGIEGDMYGNTMQYVQEGKRTAALDNINKISGNFGLQFGADIYPTCNRGNYQEAMAQEAQQMRSIQAGQEGFIYNNYRKRSGF